MRHFKRKSMRILLLGSDTKNTERFSLLFKSENEKLRDFDYEFGAIQSSERALNDLERLHPDLILLDIGMKNPSAISICQMIRGRESERHLGIIFIDHNLKNEHSIVECLELGGDDWIDTKASDREIFARINAVLRLKAMTDELRSANHRLKVLSNTDELTGLHNMRSFNQLYNQALQSCRDEEHGIGLIMLDLDHFKSVNDSTNHLVGSFVISQVGRLIKGIGILSHEDCPARYGGDEYVIFTKDNCLEDVVEKANKISEVIKNAVFQREDVEICVTASIGVAWVDKGYVGKDESPIKAADLMLYKSKKLGRNCINSIVIDEETDLDKLGQFEIGKPGIKSQKKLNVAS